MRSEKLLLWLGGMAFGSAILSFFWDAPLVKALFVISFLVSGLIWGVFLLVRGVRSGLRQKRILWLRKYVTGSDAISVGWFYIVVGAFFLAVSLAAALNAIRYGVRW